MPTYWGWMYMRSLLACLLYTRNLVVYMRSLPQPTRRHVYQAGPEPLACRRLGPAILFRLAKGLVNQAFLFLFPALRSQVCNSKVCSLLDTLVERNFLGMSLQQLELRCTSNIVHYVPNRERTEDTLLTS
jgi:hypothetical protein